MAQEEIERLRRELDNLKSRPQPPPQVIQKKTPEPVIIYRDREPAPRQPTPPPPPKRTEPASRKPILDILNKMRRTVNLSI